MTDRLDMPDSSSVVDAWLDEGPDGLQDPVREAIRMAVHSTPQSQPWSAQLLRPRAFILTSVAAAAAVGVIVLMSLVGRPDNPAATPTPSATTQRQEASNFGNRQVPFTYAVPPGSGITNTEANWDFYQFNGPQEGQFVRIRLISEGFSDPCDADAASPTVELKSAEDVAAYLKSVPELHARLRQTSDVDGRPAIAVDTRVRRDAACPEVFLWPAAVPVRAPANGQSLRFLLTDVNDSVVAVAIQADDLAAWLPTAMAFVESIHFESPAP